MRPHDPPAKSAREHDLVRIPRRRNREVAVFGHDGIEQRIALAQPVARREIEPCEGEVAVRRVDEHAEAVSAFFEWSCDVVEPLSPPVLSGARIDGHHVERGGRLRGKGDPGASARRWLDVVHARAVAHEMFFDAADVEGRRARTLPGDRARCGIEPDEAQPQFVVDPEVDDAAAGAHQLTERPGALPDPIGVRCRAPRFGGGGRRGRRGRRLRCRRGLRSPTTAAGTGGQQHEERRQQRC